MLGASAVTRVIAAAVRALAIEIGMPSGAPDLGRRPAKSCVIGKLEVRDDEQEVAHRGQKRQRRVAGRGFSTYRRTRRAREANLVVLG